MHIEIEGGRQQNDRVQEEAEEATQHLEVKVTLDLDVEDPVAVQAEALHAVPPREPYVWSLRDSLYHLLIWPLVQAAARRPGLRLHGARIDSISPQNPDNSVVAEPSDTSAER